MDRVSLKKQVIISACGRYGVFLCQLAVLMVTARIFTPQQFGVIAALLVMLQFFLFLCEFGLGAALVTANDVKISHRDGLFSLSIITGVILAIIFFLCSYGYNILFNSAIYNQISCWFAISIFLSACSIIPLAGMRRDLQFLKLSLIDIASELIALIAVVIIYKLGFPLHALASRPFFLNLFRLVLVYGFSIKTSIGRPSFGSNIGAIKYYARFTGFQFFYNIVNYLSRNIDNFVVGMVFGMQTLGFYDKAYQLMRYPMMLISYAISPAIQAVMSKRNEDLELFEKTHSKAIQVLSVCGWVAAVFIYINAKQIILLMLGNQWSEASIYVSIFSLAIPALVVQGTSGGFFQALDKTDYLFVSGVIMLILSVLSVLAGVYFNSVFVLACSLSVSFYTSCFQTYWIMYKKIFKAPLANFIKPFILGAGVGACCYVSFLILQNLWVHKIDHPIAEIVFNSFAISPGFLLAIFVIKNKFSQNGKFVLIKRIGI